MEPLLPQSAGTWACRIHNYTDITNIQYNHSIWIPEESSKFICNHDPVMSRTAGGHCAFGIVSGTIRVSVYTS